jgi:glycerate dehydrogenase
MDMKIVVLDGYCLNPGDNPWSGVEAFGDLITYDKTADSEVVERSREANILLTNKTNITEEMMKELPELKFIGVLATGYNIVDVDAARKRNIPVSHVPVYGTPTVAQNTFALLLELCNQVGYHSREVVEKGRWATSEHWSFWDFPLVELAGKTMGIVGFGRIGQAVGRIARAFGMDVIAADIYKESPPDYKFTWKEVDEIFKEADAISLHCFLTKENEGMVNKTLLSTMKKTAYLINNSRGQLINGRDLAEALDQGVLAGAALDVVAVEPIQADNPLLKAKNIIITPHNAWATLAARKRLMDTTVENIKAFIDGDPINVVN